MIKRLLLIVCFFALLLAACSKPENPSGDNESPNKVADVKIKSGQYIINEEKENTDDSALLALNVGITNQSGNTVDILPSDFTMYDSNNEKVPSEDLIVDDSGSFKLLSSTNLPKEKSVSGYLVFRINKNETYELQYQPTQSANSKKSEAVVLKISGKDYEDQQQDIVDAANVFIRNVFFGKDDSNYSSLIVNDAAQEQMKVMEQFKKNLNIGYKFTETQQEEVYHAFRAANAEKGSVSIKVNSAYIDSATVEITPEVLTLRAMSDGVETLKDQYVESNNGIYPENDEMMKAQDAYLVEHIGEVFNLADPQAPADSYKLYMKKEGDKWWINTEKDSGFDLLTEVMTVGY